MEKVGNTPRDGIAGGAAAVAIAPQVALFPSDRTLSLAIAELTPAEVHRVLLEGAIVIDGRPAEQHDERHVAGAVSIPLDGGPFAVRARTAVDRHARVVAAAGSDLEAHAIAYSLHRAGFGNVLGILAGGVEAYAGAGFEVASQRAVPAERVVEDLELGGAVLVDVRDDEDWVRGHVPGSLHIPLRSVAAASALLPRTPILVACADGSRAATAASMLRRTGHADIWRVAGAGVPYLLSRRLNLGGI